MQSLQQTSPQLQLLPANLDARRKGFQSCGVSAEKSFVHLLDGAVIFGGLDSGRVLCSDREFACLGGFCIPLSHGHGLLRIASKVVDTSVYSSSLQQMLHKPARSGWLGAVFVPPDAKLNP
jgi:hypothetical protein